MFQYHCLNPIAEKGLGLFDEEYKKSEDLQECDAVLVRSAKMHDMELPESVKVIARAGAGVNNIPVKDCAEKGVVVFNTPGANANGVKELVLAGMLLASRDIVGGIEWVAPVSYTHLRAHETLRHLVCRLLLEKTVTVIRSR